MPCSVGRDQTLLDAHRIMTEQHVRHLPVLEQGKLVGLLSQRDLYFLESVEGVDLATERVSEAMSQDVFCAGPEAHLADVVAEMAEHKYGCTVVVEGMHLVGIFTTTDALRLLAEKLRHTR